VTSEEHTVLTFGLSPVIKVGHRHLRKRERITTESYVINRVLTALSPTPPCAIGVGLPSHGPTLSDQHSTLENPNFCPFLQNGHLSCPHWDRLIWNRMSQTSDPVPGERDAAVHHTKPAVNYTNFFGCSQYTVRAWPQFTVFCWASAKSNRSPRFHNPRFWPTEKNNQRSKNMAPAKMEFSPTLSTRHIFSRYFAVA